MIHTMTKIYPTSAVCGHCGTGAVINILNYFWGTTFSLKDTFDIETMIRFGHFDFNERPSEAEICYFLAKMNFKIQEYSKVEKGDIELFINNQKEHQKKHGYKPHHQVDMEKTIESLKKLQKNKNYSLIEDTNLDIEKIIKENSDGKHMFIFGLDYNNLYGIEEEKVIGHIISSIGFESGNEKISLIETCPTGEIVYKTYDEILNAIKKAGGSEGVIIISLI